MKLKTEDHLLHAALLCGMQTGQAACRLQWLLVACTRLEVKLKFSVLQGTKNSLMRKGLVAKVRDDQKRKDISGLYVLTPKGQSYANKLFGNVEPLYKPLAQGEFHCHSTGKLNAREITILTDGWNTSVLIDGKEYGIVSEACAALGIDSGAGSAVAKLYDVAVRNAFDFAIDGGLKRAEVSIGPSTSVSLDTAVKRVLASGMRIVRDSALAKRLKKLHDYECQLCSQRLKIFDEFYAEGHHIKPIGKPYNGDDKEENILIVCPNCHVLCDAGVVKLEWDKLKKSKHRISEEFIKFHNEKIYNNPKHRQLFAERNANSVS